MRICSHLLNKFLTEKFIFCALICASKQTENYCEEGNNLFFQKLCCFFIFEKVFAICNFFYHLVFRCKVLRPFVFYLFEVQSTVLASSSSQGEKEGVLIQLLFLTREGKGRNFYDIFIKLQKLFAKKYLILARSGKLIP